MGYDMGFTPAICEESNFLFTGDPRLIAKIPRVVTRQTRLHPEICNAGYNPPHR
jgi:hypothetical protein